MKVNFFFFIQYFLFFKRLCHRTNILFLMTRKYFISSCMVNRSIPLCWTLPLRDLFMNGAKKLFFKLKTSKYRCKTIDKMTENYQETLIKTFEWWVDTIVSINPLTICVIELLQRRVKIYIKILAAVLVIFRMLQSRQTGFLLFLNFFLFPFS
jgi:hypothetical protein